MQQAATTESDIRDWCVDYLARILKRPAHSIEAKAKFNRLGLDSVMSLNFLMDLEEWLGLELDPDVVYEYTNVAELARYLAAHLASLKEGSRIVAAK